MWDTSHVPGWVHGRSCSDSTHILSVILPWTESQCYLELSSAFVLCQAALLNKSSFQMLPYHENFNTNGEEDRVQSARLQFHSDDSDFRCVRQKTGGTLYFFTASFMPRHACNIHLHVRTRFCSTSCIWRGTDWVHGDSWLKSPSLWLEEPKPIWTRFLKSEDVIRVSGIQILCCAESIFSPDESKNTVVSDEITEEQRIMLYYFSVSCELTELDSIRATWIYQTKSSWGRYLMSNSYSEYLFSRI